MQGYKVIRFRVMLNKLQNFYDVGQGGYGLYRVLQKMRCNQTFSLLGNGFIHNVAC